MSLIFDFAKFIIEDLIQHEGGAKDDTLDNDNQN